MYNALLEALTLGTTTIPCYQFTDIYRTMNTKNGQPPKSKLEEQYRVSDKTISRISVSSYVSSLHQHDINVMGCAHEIVVVVSGSDAKRKVCRRYKG